MGIGAACLLVSSITPTERSIRGRLGAAVQHSRHDPKETTVAARAAFLRKFEADVDPAGELPPEERQRRALAARRAHFLRLALKSAQSRRLNRERKKRTEAFA